MSYLCLDHITKTFEGHIALDDVSLSFAKGEFVAVLGPSGCGKTTLLNVIAGISPPDSGRIGLEGTDITGRRPEKRNFGMVFQNYALFPNLNVEENIGYGLFARPKAQIMERVETLIDLTGLRDLAKRLPAELSGGQRQRVALARALAREPAVLLLDEPLSALDAQVRMVLGQEILRLQRETGITAVMVTHDQEEALALADHVVLMNEGRVVQDGDPCSLYAEPATRFAADFIGHMNTVNMPEIHGGAAAGIRFEEVRVRIPSESVLAQENTWVGQVAHAAFMGAFYRVEILLNDFRTRIYADMPSCGLEKRFSRGDLVAVTLPADNLRLWAESFPAPAKFAL